MANVAFDYTNLAEVEGGIGDVELRDLRPCLEEAGDKFLENPPGFMRLPKTTDFFDLSKALADEVHSSGATDFIHVGIGGSALGPIAVHRALNHPLLQPARRARRTSPPLRREHRPRDVSCYPRRCRHGQNLGQRRHQERLDRRDDGQLPRPSRRSRGGFGRERLRGTPGLHHRPRRGLSDTDS